MKNNCKICGKEFIHHTYNQLYCSKECYKTAHKQQKKIYRQTKEGKEKHRLYNKNHYHTKKGQYTRKLYNKSEQGKRVAEKYSHTNKRKKSIKKYQQTQKYKDAIKKYNESIKGKINIIKKNAIKRARLKNVVHEDYKDWLKEQLSQKYFICYWCGEKFPISEFTKDHIIPISKGGPDTKENLVPCCRHCNCSKNNKDPEEFNNTLQQPRLII